MAKHISQKCKFSKAEILDYHKSQNVSFKKPFECPECSEDEIKYIVKSLKASGAVDVFNTSNNFVKTHCDELAPILTNLINKHMFEGTFPDELKKGLVKPIYKKKGCKQDMKNYRPITILPIVSKIFEAVMYRRISNHCDENKFFSKNQFGYQEKSCTEAAMLHTLDDIYTALDSNFETALVTIDLSNAFDCLNHEILLAKLSKFNFPTFFFNLLKSYLRNRTQAVQIGEMISENANIFCGTPQGGVLSGLLFNIYVNSIFNLTLYCKLRLYCDDMSLIAFGIDKNDLKNIIETDLSKIDNWLNYHYLSANFSKTNYILFKGRKKFENFTDKSLNVKINNNEIARIESVKIIGLHIDEQLNFSTHISHIKRKIIPFISKFCYIRNFLNEKTALKLYYANVYSHLTFMNAIWSVAPKYLLESLGVAQRKALRIVYNKERLSHNYELFNEKVLPLNLVSRFHENLLVFKIQHKLIKNNKSLITANMIHNQNTRSNSNFIPQETRTIAAQNNFYYRALISYNSLPSDIKKFNNIGIFKTRLKEYLYESVYRTQ